jgi:hypothetical protein
MATFIQSATGLNGSGSNQNLFTSNFGSLVTAGNMIIAVCCIDAANSTTQRMTDSLSNVYTPLAYYSNGTLTIIAYCAYVKTGGTIAVQATENFLDGQILAQEWSGMGVNNVLDTSKTSTGSSIATTTGNTYTSIATNLVVFNAIMLQSQTNTYGAGTGWTNMITTASSFTSGALESQTTTSAATALSGSFTMTNTGINYAMLTFGVYSANSNGGYDTESQFGQSIQSPDGISSSGAVH